MQTITTFPSPTLPSLSPQKKKILEREAGGSYPLEFLSIWSQIDASIAHLLKFNDVEWNQSNNI